MSLDFLKVFAQVLYSFRDSYASDYEGGRSLGDILKFANKVLGCVISLKWRKTLSCSSDAVLKAADEKQAIKLAAGAPVIFVLSSRDEQKIKDFTRIAQKFQDTLTFAIINNDEETLKWISDAEETYRGDFEYAAMESWILQKRLPLYPSIDGFKWKILTERKKKMVLAAIDVKHPDHQKYKKFIDILFNSNLWIGLAQSLRTLLWRTLNTLLVT